MKGATIKRKVEQVKHYVSIHAPNEGSDPKVAQAERELLVSIHAPNEGSDHLHCVNHWKGLVSIHAPNEGSDARADWQDPDN